MATESKEAEDPEEVHLQTALAAVAAAALPPPPTYFQPQSGGLCRKHALNAYLGGPVIADGVFKYLCDVFDGEHGHPQGTTAKAGTVYFEDAGAYDDSCDNVLSFILHTAAGVDTILLPIGKGHCLDTEARALQVTSALAFNKGHVWYMRLTDEGWYHVDSMSGIRKQKPPGGSVHGFLLILDGNRLPDPGAPLRAPKVSESCVGHATEVNPPADFGMSETGAGAGAGAGADS